MILGPFRNDGVRPSRASMARVRSSNSSAVSPVARRTAALRNGGWLRKPTGSVS